MDYEMIKNKVKAFCFEEFDSAVQYAKSSEQVKNYRAIAYGALQFAINNLFPSFNNNLSYWWENDMWNRFEELIIKKN